MPAITRRKKRTARPRGALSRSGSRLYRSLFEESPIAICRSTPEGLIREANAALASLLGFPDRAAVQGSNIQQFYQSPSDREALLCGIDPGGESRRNGVAL